ncbi:MAG: hypothetical protein ABFR75_14130 [Acidobacteriota bacterium]
MKNLQKILCISIVLMLLPFTTIASGQQRVSKKSFKVRSLVKVELKSSTKFYLGVCPKTIKMTGIITLSKAMSVKYYFVKYDGVLSKSKPVTSQMAKGLNHVHFSWKINKDCQAWVQLVVKTLSSKVKSKKVEIKVNCDEEKSTKPPITKFNRGRQYKPELVKAITFHVNKNSLTKLKTMTDLELSKIELQSDTIKDYQKLFISVHVKNKGGTLAPPCKLAIIFHKSGGASNCVDHVAFNLDFPSLGPGHSGVWHYNFKNFCIGKWSFNMMVNNKATIPEHILENNKGSGEFTVIQ